MSWDEAPILEILFHYPVKLCLAVTELCIIKNPQLQLPSSFFCQSLGNCPNHEYSNVLVPHIPQFSIHGNMVPVKSAVA